MPPFPSIYTTKLQSTSKISNQEKILYDPHDPPTKLFLSNSQKYQEEPTLKQDANLEPAFPPLDADQEAGQSRLQALQEDL
jgi:hypothetical protein